MNIAVTGAGGFLGLHLIDALAKREDMRVLAMTSQIGLKEHENVIYIGRDAAIDREIDFSVIDVLINCAFPRNADGVNMANGLFYIQKTLEAAVSGGVGAVINISSQSVYSQTRMDAANEQTELNLETSYAVGKYASELLTNSICRDIPHANIRLASLIGVHFEQRLINKMVSFAVNGSDLRVVGGNQKFGFLDVRDAADAIVRMLNSNKQAWREVYNLGPQRAYSLREIAQIITDLAAELYGIKVSINEESDEGKQNSDLNCDLFYDSFCWQPMFSLKDTTRDIFEAEMHKYSLG